MCPEQPQPTCPEGLPTCPPALGLTPEEMAASTASLSSPEEQPAPMVILCLPGLWGKGGPTFQSCLWAQQHHKPHKPSRASDLWPVHSCWG